MTNLIALVPARSGSKRLKDKNIIVTGASGGIGNSIVKKLYSLELAKLNTKLSTSLLQRKLRIGYPRAARLMDELEEEGIVGPMQDSIKSRDVIIN